MVRYLPLFYPLTKDYVIKPAKSILAIGIVIIASVVMAQAAFSKNPRVVSWATWDQRADKEIANGGIYGRGWGQASPKLKYIVTQMIQMKFGKNSPALCYAHRESGLNPLALSRTNDHHVFQLNYSAHHRTFDYNRLDKPDVGYGIIAAWRLSKGGTDYSAWRGGSHSC